MKEERRKKKNPQKQLEKREEKNHLGDPDSMYMVQQKLKSFW